MRDAFVTAALAAPIVLAAPTKRQGSNIDVTVLQFALTLEHLENVFYKGALQKFSPDDFKNAGYSDDYYNNLKYIAGDEQSHVEFLEAALTAAGQTPTAACIYSFPYTDVESFITLSSILEGVGTSAYLGGAPLITSKDYLTAAGSILVTEALHTSYQRAAINEVPFANPYGTPLDPTSVYTLASAFIKQCPASNPTLPFTPFPALTLTTTAGTCEEPDCKPRVFEKHDWEPMPSAPAPPPSPPAPESTPACTDVPDYDWQNIGGGYGSDKDGKPYPPPPSAPKNQPALYAGATVSFTSAGLCPAGSFLTFVSGLTVTSVAASIDGTTASVAIPSTAMGQTYVFLTSAAAANNKLDGTTIIAGPAILEVAPAAPVIDFNEA